jgi:hypothetical protein
MDQVDYLCVLLHFKLLPLQLYQMMVEKHSHRYLVSEISPFSGIYENPFFDVVLLFKIMSGSFQHGLCTTTSSNARMAFGCPHSIGVQYAIS